MATTPFDDLEDKHLPPAIGASTSEKQDNRPKYACDHCAGTGIWTPGRGSFRGKCHACGGRGHFLNAAVDRAKKRGQAKAGKAKRLTNSIDAFHEEKPGLIDTLQGMVEWNGFAASLCENFQKYGNLSDKQVAAAERMVAKVAATRAARAAERDLKSVVVDLAAIRALFQTAHANGHKRPKYRAEDLVISRAPDNGRNAGALYVCGTGDDYVGKITADDIFRPTNAAGSDVAGKLATIAADPRAAAVAYGRKTGSCSCCGRELTNHESIGAGIGPICATKWGL